MTISNKLFNAILAMDSYNRGYDEGIKLTGTKVGNATITKDSEDLGFVSGTQDRLDQAAGFYAVAYTMPSGKKIISYRGTDGNPLDIATGWVIGGGLLGTPYNQSQLAVEFFNAVAGSEDPYTANMFTTGHSLGGGLAGLVAAAYGQPADIFDNMPFEFAVSTLIPLLFASGYPLPDYSAITGYATTGEALESIRLLQSTPVTEYNSYNNSLGSIDLHSQSLLVTLMYGAENNHTDWQVFGEEFINSLFDNNIALAAGANSIEGTRKEKSDFSEIMRSAIAYSVIDEGTRVFGDTAIRALFDDANELGKVLKADDHSTTLKDLSGYISDIFTQYAGQLALGKILQSTNPTAANDNYEPNIKVCA